MKKIILTKGLPASGKSTWAKALLDKEKGRWVRVNKDDLRAMCHNSHWSKSNEKFVLALRDHIILQAIANGKHVIVDDTNLSNKHFRRIQSLTAGQATVEINDEFLAVSVEECIRRDLQRPHSVGEKVIRKMYNQFLKTTIAAPPYLADRPDCIIVDMDGTLALFNGRNPYEASKCDTDLPNSPVVDTVKKWQDSVKVVICSGRTDDAKDKTSQWLDKYGIRYDALHMRKTGDQRKDAVIKEEIYRAHIEGNYNVTFVLDDRQQVVDLWRSLGLTVFQVAEGDF